MRLSGYWAQIGIDLGFRVSGVVEKKMETTIILGLCSVYIGIMEKNMKTTIILGLYRDYSGMTEKKAETFIMGLYRCYI